VLSIGAKRTTLDDLDGQLCTLFQNMYASSGAHNENLNEDGPTLSAPKMLPNDGSFWQYKVYANIRRGSLEKCVNGVIENVDFQGFRALCLRHLRK